MIMPACFKWAVLYLAYIQPKSHTYRLSNYPPNQNILKFGNLIFPMQVKDISKFEEMRNILLSVCVVVYDEKNKLYNLYLSKNYGPNKIEVDLLLLQDPDNPSNKHYIYGLKIWAVYYTISVNTRRQNHHAVKTCSHPLNLGINITSNCISICEKPQRIEMQNSYIFFKNYFKQMKVPFVIYAC